VFSVNFSHPCPCDWQAFVSKDYDTHSAGTHAPWWVEEWFEMDVPSKAGGVKFRGIVDRVDKDLATGATHIREFKSNQRFKSEVCGVA